MALNNLKRVDMPLNKETKPNLKMIKISDGMRENREIMTHAFPKGIRLKISFIMQFQLYI